MPEVTFRGAKSRDADVGSRQVTVDGKKYLLRLDTPTEVPASVVKVLKQDDEHNYDYGSSKTQEG